MRLICIETLCLDFHSIAIWLLFRWHLSWSMAALAFFKASSSIWWGFWENALGLEGLVTGMVSFFFNLSVHYNTR